jgi:comEA protein
LFTSAVSRVNNRLPPGDGGGSGRIPNILGYRHSKPFPFQRGHLAAIVIVPWQEVNMTQTKKLLTLLVILAMAAVSTVSLGAAEKQAGGAGDKLVNINTADAGQLVNLPQVGPKMAQRILDFRKSNGNFKRVQDLMKVKGIGEKIFAKLQPLITI